MAMAEFALSVPAVEITAEDLSEDEDPIMAHVDSSVLLADAIRKMDGLIGDFRPEPPCEAAHDPIVKAIMEHCDKLYVLMRQWDNEHDGVEVKGPSHASNCVSSDVKQLIISWLSSRRMESPVEVDQLRRDKEELLKQVVLLQQQQEVSAAENDKLCKKVEELERRCVEKDQHNRSLSEELKSTKSVLHSKEVEVRHLKDQIQAGYRSNSPMAAHSSKQSDRPKRVTVVDPNNVMAEGGLDRASRKGSFKKTLIKAFGRKKSPAAALHQPTPASPTIPKNSRAMEFHARDGRQLAEWFTAVGLDMYTDIVERNLSSGEQLVTMVTTNNSAALVQQIGIVSTLHRKKLCLAVEDAVSEVAGPLCEFDHHWVADWLTDIGLPQYKRKFLDARIDGRMLNVITMDNLNLLNIDAPFHIASLKRAIQALRMCSYNKDYLKENSPGTGSKKLLHWSSKDVSDWVKSIELDEYVMGLEEAGIHGALMLLDVHFTSESLAGALGISQSMGLVRNHLSRKFMELIGPISAQKKYDAMQSKNFVALDPTDLGKAGHRTRSRSLGSRRGRSQGVQETLLCPLDEFPPRGVDCSATPPPVRSPNPDELETV